MKSFFHKSMKLTIFIASVAIAITALFTSLPANAGEKCEKVTTSAWPNGDGTYSMQDTYRCVYTTENGGKGDGYSEVYEKQSDVVSMREADYLYWSRYN
jgi:hypothetical protein